MKTFAFAFAFAAFVAAQGASAVTPIYRCGPTGKEFSQTPCAGGSLLEASDSRTAAQQAEARRVAIRERQLAGDLAHERQVQEVSNPPALASGFHSRPATPEPAVTAHPQKRAHAKAKKIATTDFVAYAPRKAKAAGK